VDLRDEMTERFRRYYQRFVGYPTADFQLPANTSVRYALLQHAGSHPWDTPMVKASIAGFGGVITTLSVGFLLSDQASNMMATDALSYTLPGESATVLNADDNAASAEPIALDTHHSTLGDRPESIQPIEFSQPSASASASASATVIAPDSSTIEETTVISLAPFSTGRFDVQLRPGERSQPDSESLADASPVDASSRTPDSTVAIAPADRDRRSPLTPSRDELESAAPQETYATDGQLSAEDIEHLSQGFAASVNTPSVDRPNRRTDGRRANTADTTDTNTIDTDAAHSARPRGNTISANPNAADQLSFDDIAPVPGGADAANAVSVAPVNSRLLE
jgi:hypothetical protein